MSNVHVHHADPIHSAECDGVDPVHATAIVVDLVQPRFSVADLGQSRELFVTDAKAIADALWASLPGGTISQLCVEMLTRQASLFRVPMLRTDGNDDRDR